LSGIGGDQEFDAFAALRVGPVALDRFDRDLEMAAAHAQFGDQRGGGPR
jgi:hypothetical protein